MIILYIIDKLYIIWHNILYKIILLIKRDNIYKQVYLIEMIARHNHLMKKVPKVFHNLVKPVLKHSFGSPEPRYLYNVDSAMKIKKNIKIPVIVVGGIRKLDDIETIISSGKSDFVSMARPFILEPTLVKKFMERKEKQSKCINCNYCQIGIEIDSLKCYYGKV